MAAARFPAKTPARTAPPKAHHLPSNFGARRGRRRGGVSSPDWRARMLRVQKRAGREVKRVFCVSTWGSWERRLEEESAWRERDKKELLRGARARECLGGARAWEAHEREFWRELCGECVKRERAPRRCGPSRRVCEERGRDEGPSPGRREPASLRHEQARGTSSEAVALRDDDEKGSRNSLSLFLLWVLCKCLWEGACG